MSNEALARFPERLERPRLRERTARSLVLARLAAIEDGALLVREPDGTLQRFGRAHGPAPGIEVCDPRFWPAIAFGGSVGGAEAWIEGWWDADDLTAVIRLLARNQRATEGLDSGLARLARPARRWWHRRRSNTRTGSRRNIAAHYDLGNEFFRRFLDPSMTYSSAVFEHPGQALEDAQTAKYERLCRRLEIDARHRVLEIGTGWGGFAIHAARTHGCHVTTTTISKEQHAWAARRIREEGLEDRIELRLQDYRDLEGSYDRLVSIEMIEAVGHEHLATYFETCSERLRPDGAMALQAIVHLDQDFEEAVHNVDFIKKYIFPGGQLVSAGAMIGAMKDATDLRMTHLEDLTPHYAETLRRWRDRMSQNLDEVEALGLDERFLRMWAFYFAYCEGGFDERVIGLTQAVFEKPGARLSRILPDEVAA